jgi:hypothetical protein
MRGSDETRRLTRRRIEGQARSSQDWRDDAVLAPLLNQICKEHQASLLAVLVYGSWLRGKRDTMLDFYVLVEDYQTLDSAWQRWLCALLPPNVYHIHCRSNESDPESDDLRAKYAVLTLDRFKHAMKHDFHSYFWARFAQPCEIIYAKNDQVQATLVESFSRAALSFTRRVLPAIQDRFDSRELWTQGLAMTYRCELRTESGNRADSLYDFAPDYYAELTTALAQDLKQFEVAHTNDVFRNNCSIRSRKLSGLGWGLRRIQGKLLSVLRLFKAAFTFNEPLAYILWKIERHSGQYIEPTPRQLRHPLIFAWPLLWQLYRRGAFR